MSNRNFSTDQAFVAISLVSVLAAIVTGFWLLGSPGQQRLISLDNKRLEDLSGIASAISNQNINVGEGEARPLPETLPTTLPTSSSLTDPVSNQPYEYRRLTDSTYELCATFATASSGQDDRSWLAQSWPHPAGRHCFKLDKSGTQPLL
jgi:hypothetical protein